MRLLIFLCVIFLSGCNVYDADDQLFYILGEQTVILNEDLLEGVGVGDTIWVELPSGGYEAELEVVKTYRDPKKVKGWKDAKNHFTLSYTDGSYLFRGRIGGQRYTVSNGSVSKIDI